MDNYISPEQAARILLVSARRIRQLIELGKLESIKTSSARTGRHRISVESIRRYARKEQNRELPDSAFE